jgi:hypothetical protein
LPAPIADIVIVCWGWFADPTPPKLRSMDKSSFAILFETVVQRTLEQAGLGSAQNDVLVEFHGLSNPLNPIPTTKAIDLLWISPDRFYFIVDVGVILDGKSPALMFVRPTGHEPVPFTSSWDPADLGPFKAIGPMTRGGCA